MPDFLKALLHKISPPQYTIRISNCRAVLTGGKASMAFIRDCDEIARSKNIQSGWIWGLRTGNGTRLDFSSNISMGDRQRFRNIMGVHTE
ncbi:MAG: DUF3634 family protein [Candidatus Aegiribacteria sp.]|nr:DUF3634 family protein [Candidatus Aegiribacteria sp.]